MRLSIIIMCIIRLLTFLVMFSCLNTFSQTGEDTFNKARIRLEQGKKRKAIELFESALILANSSNNIDLVMECHLELAELKNNIIDYKEALDHYKKFATLYRKKTQTRTEALENSVQNLSYNIKERNNIIEDKDRSLDSLANAHIKSKLAITELELEKQKSLIAVQIANNRRNILIAALGVGIVVFVFMVRSYYRKRKNNVTLTNMNKEILNEKKKSDELLLNILPEKVAEELREDGKSMSMKYGMATVMFTDFKGFTKYSEEKSPEEIVQILDYYFCGFDNILSDYKIEKIKTIGDAYLCVSGLPEKNPNQVHDMINCARQMIDFVEEAKASDKLNGHEGMEIRIGIHCGPLVAGIVGTKKFSFDIWGDTVNIAARMEQSGVPSHINVSESIFEKVKDEYTFKYRGEVEAKNKGKMKMYLVV